MKKGRFSSQLALVALSSGREIDVVGNVALCENKKRVEENNHIAFLVLLRSTCSISRGHKG